MAQSRVACVVVGECRCYFRGTSPEPQYRGRSRTSCGFVPWIGRVYSSTLPEETEIASPLGVVGETGQLDGVLKFRDRDGSDRGRI